MEIEVKYRFQKEFFLKLKNHFIAAAEKSIASQVTKGTVNSALHGTTAIPAESGPNAIHDSTALNGSAAYNSSVAWSSASLNGSAGTSNLELIFKSKNVQSNYFFDSKLKELEPKRINFRLRRSVKWMDFNDIKSNSKIATSPCINVSFITIKGLGDKGGTLKDGISKINELETVIDNSIFDEIIESPNTALPRNADKIDLIKTFQSLVSPSSFIELCGKFKNTRLVFQMKLENQKVSNDDFLILELDETEYDFGTAYELEVETKNPERAKWILEEMFKQNGIEFTYSKRSKFGNLKAGSII